MPEKPRLLVVDDEPQYVGLLKAVLPPKSYDVVTAANGVEAMGILSKQDIDLILLDVRMPLMDGFEVTRRVRAHERTKSIPIILLTGLREMADRIKGIEAGCDEFVNKPFDNDEVLARIRTLLKLNYYRSQIDEKKKFERVINRMNEGLIVCDSFLNITRTNEKGRELLGFEDLSSGWVSRLGKAYRNGFKGNLEHALVIRDLDFDLERPGSSPKGLLIVSFSSSVIKDPEDQTTSIVIVLRDVTEQRKETFQKADFLSLMSWKLRSPLSTSLDHLDVLRRSVLTIENKPFRRSVDITVDKVSHFIRMTEKIFDYLAAHSSDRFEGEPAGKGLAMQRVEALVRSAVKLHPDKKIVCSFSLPSSGETVAVSDGLFEIAAKNLVENAVKFGKQAVTKISLSALREGDQVRFSFADNGPGIPSERKRGVFGTFQHAGDGAASGAGLGLGLAIVKKIVESKHGEIKVVDTKEGGTCICFTLPLALDPALAAV